MVAGRIYQPKANLTYTCEKIGKKHKPYKCLFLGTSIGVVICLTLLFTCICVAGATDYYVSTTGNNNWDGLSPGTAWRTIAYAVGSSSPVTAGDSIYVLDGTYVEGSNKIRFQKDGITLTAYDQTNPNVVVDGVTTDPNDDVIRVDSRNNITISKLEVIHGDNGIWVVDSSDVSISDCHVHHTGETEVNGEGISFLGGDHGTIQNCTVHDCGWNQIMLGGRSDQNPGEPIQEHVSVINCTVYNTGHSSIDLMGDIDYLDIIECNADIYQHQEAYTGVRYMNCSGNTFTDKWHIDSPLYHSVIESNIFDFGSATEIIEFYDETNNLTFRNNYIRGDVTDSWMVDLHENHAQVLFDGDDIKSDYEDYEILIRGGTATVRNQVPSTYTVATDDATITVEYTDGRTFSVDGSGSYTTYIFSSGTHTIKVTTGGDTTPPSITAQSPTGTSVPIAATMSVTFNEAMNKTSAQNAFSISPSVSGSFSWDGNKMIFTPSSNLVYNTIYTVTINTQAKDLAGNNLKSLYNWQFTTLHEPSPPSPPIVYVATDGSGNYNCDGTDDQLEINTAIDYVATHVDYTTVHLKAGTYTIDGGPYSIILKGSNKIFEGDSNTTTTIKLKDGNNYDPLL